MNISSQSNFNSAEKMDTDRPVHEAVLEHLNITVSDPEITAALLCELFGWRKRWQGDSINGGLSIHVGGENSYLAVYGPKENAREAKDNTYVTKGGLNHLGVVVQDIDETEQKVIAAGLTPTSHADYEPGRRFYFDDFDGIEYEVVSYK